LEGVFLDEPALSSSLSTASRAPLPSTIMVVVLTSFLAFKAYAGMEVDGALLQFRFTNCECNSIVLGL
jgi:hypothetical protein